MGLPNRTSCFALLAILAAGLFQTAQARQVKVDFDGLSFDTTGENFAFADTSFGVGGGTISFQLNFGSGAQLYDYCMNANGFVAFVASGSGCGASDTPSGDYVAAFFAPLAVGGNTLRGSGLVDSSAPYAAGDAAAAYRFIWEASDSTSSAVLAELLLLDRGAGNFDLLFGYGSDAFGVDGTPGGGTQVVQLGSNSNSLAGPFSSTTDYGFSFSGGTCAGCGGSGGNGGGTGGGGGSVSVPEPSTLALMFGGMFMLMFSRRLRGANRRLR
ncbi:MAG: PEP-CTERM sorting domain-containing protein [Pseudomonadota bacterium]